MSESQTKKGLNISAKSFLTAIIVIFSLMVVAYLLTFLIPGGVYERIDGQITSDDSFTYVDGGIPFFKWLLSPLLVLGAEGNSTLIAVIIFLLVIGGVFNALGECGLMKYMLDKITARFGATRYRLMAVIVFFFMALGSLIGSFEECVPLVPIVVALSLSLGWDALTGMAMSLLAVGCGFAAGVFNPFTVGVAQELAGLPMFSGVWLRALSFVLIYALLLLFIRLHAKRVERPVAEAVSSDFQNAPAMNRALITFASIVGVGILIVLSSAFLPFLRDYTMIIVALMFLIAGIAAPLLSGMGGKSLVTCFAKGVVTMLPAVLMILMASSIKYTLEEARVLHTILHGAVGVADGMPRFAVILFIYLIALVMNFFVASGSAEAFMLIPLITPLAAVFGIPAQLTVVAFAFGDGFSNVLYPTNPALLIALGIAGIGYTDWVRWSWKFQLANFALTSGLLLFGLFVGYGL